MQILPNLYFGIFHSRCPAFQVTFEKKKPTTSFVRNSVHPRKTSCEGNVKVTHVFASRFIVRWRCGWEKAASMNFLICAQPQQLPGFP